jgi:tRNA threonylcarbamoyladenosine biosynthesis protein TsaB
MLVLGIDTCGPSGSVALGRLNGPNETGQYLEILGLAELAGRSYSANLVAAVGELLARHNTGVWELGAIVAVNGPGSFTGVRVGLSAVKGLAEGAQIPVVAVSRLAVLAGKSNIPSTALDAHRHEVFLRVAQSTANAREMLAGASELVAFEPPPARIAVCDDAAALLLSGAWPSTELIRISPPTAVDALELAMPLVVAGAFVDLARLDGHYLRRSDAEIFGAQAAAGLKRT